MEYYIVMNEWNYPTTSGRDIVGDYDTCEEAEAVAESEYNEEFSNFLDNVNHNIDNESSGRMFGEDGDCNGYALRSTQKELFFRSVIIRREVI